MSEINDILDSVLTSSVIKAVISNPVKGETQCVKITARASEGKYRVEKLTEKQAFHSQLTVEQLKELSLELMGISFRQMNIWDNEREYEIKISKKGKLLFTKRKAAVPIKLETAHNREKNYIISEGNVPVLVDMGIFTKDGRVAAQMYDKFRQINRFIELIDDEVSAWSKDKPLRVIDFGCGKSYLTFVLYHYLTEIRGLDTQIIGLDLKADVIKKCNAAAEKYGYLNLKFELGDINGYKPENGVDMVITLHACDTATDYALFNAVKWGAKLIFSVPCCQHELNFQMKSETLSLFTRYGIIKERTAALMTDAIRADLLECCGYKTQVLEFVDLQHTPKNLLLRAVKKRVNSGSAQKYIEEIDRTINEFALDPTLYRLMKEDGLI